MPPRPPGTRGPSQLDVARAAGVSTQTVSRVVSGQDNVRAETARRVRVAIDDLGYRVHAAAASLASGRTRSIGVISAATAQYATAAIMLGVEAAASAARYAVTTAMVAHDPDPAQVADAFDRLERQGVEGVVVLSPSAHVSRALQSRADRLPTVGHRLSGETGMDLLVDQDAIGTLATQHLLDLGHPHVWHVSGDLSWPDASMRRAAWERTLRARGIQPPPVLAGDWTPGSGYRAGQILARDQEVSAVFVGCDEMAFGVVRALTESGRSVPGEVSVVGVDDIDLAAFATPALTTVRQPFEDVGRAAARRVIDQIEQLGTNGLSAPPPGAPLAVPLAPRLIERASSARYHGPV